MTRLLHKKNRAHGGFTLAELLIVVAIIGVLVAISIPIFSSQLTKAKIATDQANVRSAKAAAAAEYMTDGETGSVSYIYDGSRAIKIGQNEEISTFSSVTGYGKTDGKDNANAVTGATGTPKGGYVEITVSDDPSENSGQEITAKWVTNVNLDTPKLTKESIKEQVTKAGLTPEDVVTFTADRGTILNSSSTDNLAQMFQGFDNLRSIDLSNATLQHGDLNIFQNLPPSVETIVLPKCDSPYDIRGIWYYADGTRVGTRGSGSGADATNDTRIQKGNSGKTIYRHIPG